MTISNVCVVSETAYCICLYFIPYFIPFCRCFVNILTFVSLLCFYAQFCV